MSLAIFDLDNTLLGGDSDHAWGQFLVDKGIVDGADYQRANDHFYALYQSGELDILEFLEFALKPLAAHPRDQLERWHREFMQQSIAPMRLPRADALLQQHRERGDDLLIITATNEFVTAPIAASLGVEHLLATTPELVDGAYTGRVVGTPCFQAGKVARLKDWLAKTGHNLDNSWFYSDSHNDLPLLELVDNPVAVDPDATLEAVARSKQWPIISLRD